MSELPGSDELPQFLRNSDAFLEHLDAQFSEHDNVEKGDDFVAFACRVLPLCDFWGDMAPPEPSERRSHDHGVDFEAAHPTNSARVMGQAKFRMREVAALDGVISKFAAHEQRASVKEGEQSTLFAEQTPSLARYVLVTSSNLGEIRRRYEDSRLPSLEFYRGLIQDDRLQILDGPRLLGILQTLYRQSYFIAPEIDLHLGAEIIHVDGVYLSIVSAGALRHLYSQYGSSLFFENIREFLGVVSGEGSRRDARGSVNEAITDTLQRLPTKMLGRNNGITFRASAVEHVGPRTLRLRGGSIVNGCQTTMCIVQAGPEADQAMIVVKIVVGEDSWEVAKSANYQNQVSRIDLELARFLRPQFVRKIATDLGYSLPATEDLSISNVLEDIHHTKISYEAIKFLYIGLFSRYPSNLFEGHYSEVRLDVLNAASARGRQEHIMRVLFQLLVQMKSASEEFKERHRDEAVLDVFRRFFREEEPRYNCLLGLLTACGCVGDDLASKEAEAETAWLRLERFLGRLEVVLVRYKDYFNRVFRHAVVTLAAPVIRAGTEQREMLQRMSREIETHSGQKFQNLVLELRMHMKNDDAIAERVLEFDDGRQRATEDLAKRVEPTTRGRRRSAPRPELSLKPAVGAATAGTAESSARQALGRRCPGARVGLRRA